MRWVCKYRFCIENRDLYLCEDRKRRGYYYIGSKGLQDLAQGLDTWLRMQGKLSNHALHSSRYLICASRSTLKYNFGITGTQIKYTRT